MKKNNDYLEKVLTAISGGVGIIAIFFNLNLKGYGAENWFDAIKDIAGLGVVIAVFLIANKIFRKGRSSDFNKIFEFQLKNWVARNDYLICENFDEDGKGKYSKRYCSMVIEHSNLVTRKKKACDAAENKEKGAFVYLPYFDDNNELRNEFEFRFNSRTFERQTIYRTESGEVNLNGIIEQFALRIDDNFRDYFNIKANPAKKTITVSFEKSERDESTARNLIDMIEFVKTMVLAIA